MADSYDDKFENVMEYVTMQLDDEGRRVKIGSTSELRTIMERFDAMKSRARKQSPRFSDDFLDKITNTRAAREAVGKVFGRRGGIGTIVVEQKQTPPQRTLPAKVQLQKQQGKEIYRYNKGYATMTYAYSKRNNVVVKRPRDTNTGRFISKNQPFYNIDDDT